MGDEKAVGRGPSPLTMYTLLSAQPLTNWIIRGAIAPQMQCVVRHPRVSGSGFWILCSATALSSKLILFCVPVQIYCGRHGI